jgi:putative flippase GtrA
VNTAVVYALRGSTGLYLTGIIAWIAAATLTWILNRSWTFRGPHAAGLHRQWARFLGANSIGFLLYYSVYATLVTSCARCATQPVIAVLAGAAVGLVANFTLSRQVVFR